MISMSGGNINANVELLTAPTNEMIGPKFGIIAASMTVFYGYFHLKKNYQEKIFGKKRYGTYK